ncbi:MAG: recombinase family protein [Eubacteriales bacterium]|nr:recombinase family protein [Eubacteriales bacterium]
MKAVLYCRTSTSNPYALDMIRGQQNCLIDYAKENGIEIAGIYSDVGCLGSTLDNLGIQAVVQAIREGRVDTVLITDRDRLNKGVRLEELQSIPVVVLAEEAQRAEREAGREL